MPAHGYGGAGRPGVSVHACRPVPVVMSGIVNDVTIRPEIWRRFDGDEWAAFDALPPRVRARLQEHAYDAWAVNALMLWKTFRRKHASSVRGEVTLLRYIAQCEALEREGYDAKYRKEHGEPLPHVAAKATVLRYDSAARLRPRTTQSGASVCRSGVPLGLGARFQPKKRKWMTAFVA